MVNNDSGDTKAAPGDPPGAARPPPLTRGVPQAHAAAPTAAPAAPPADDASALVARAARLRHGLRPGGVAACDADLRQVERAELEATVAQLAARLRRQYTVAHWLTVADMASCLAAVAGFDVAAPDLRPVTAGLRTAFEASLRTFDETMRHDDDVAMLSLLESLRADERRRSDPRYAAALGV